MSVACFLSDEDVNHDFLRGALRLAPEIDIVSVQQLGLRSEPDGIILGEAIRFGKILVTHDANTMLDTAYKLMESGQSIPGIIVVTQSAPIRRQIDDFILIATASDAEEWINRIEFVPF